MITLNITNAILTPFTASNETGGGPYLHDTTTTLLTTETATTLTQALGEGQQYPNVSVVSSTGFPDSPGYVVFGFGHSYQVGPVPYLGVSGANTLFLNPSFVITEAVPVGASVNLAVRLSDDQAPGGDNDCWLTSSPAGRVACENNISDIAAGGRNITLSVVYPGDVGLGGAGLPTHGVARLSDIVEVFAGDDIDAEVAEARQS